MKRSAALLLPAFLAMLPALPAAAQAPSAVSGAGVAEAPAPAPLAPRFTFTAVEGGVLKLDAQTGKASYCSKGPGGFACVPVADARDAYEEEIARLQQELAALRGGAPGSGARGSGIPGPAAPDAGAPTAPKDGTLSEIDQMLGYMDYIYRRLREIVQGAPPPGDRL